jgi:polysaccharide transporter, PST family
MQLALRVFGHLVGLNTPNPAVLRVSIMKSMTVEEVQSRAKSAPMMLLIRRFTTALIGLASTILVARFLSPRDFGLAAMSMAVVSLGDALRNFGLTNAVLRKGEINEDEVTFCFWFNLVSTLLMSAIFVAGAPLIAAYFDEPEVRVIMYGSIIGFAIGGFAMQHNAIMKRNLEFRQVAFCDTAAVAVGFIVTLALAIIRRDYWAIVIGLVAQSIARAAINIYLTRWMPGRPRRIEGIRELMYFGFNTSLYATLNQASRQSTTLIIGYFFNSALLGYFNRSYALFKLPLSNLLEPIGQANMPILARLRLYPDHYRTTYLSLVEMLSVLLIPASAVIDYAGPSLALTLLGPQWEQSGEALSYLAPALAVYGGIYPISNLLITQNRAGELRLIALLDVVFRAGGALIGAQFSFLAAIAGFSIGSVLTLPARFLIAGRVGTITAGDQLRAILPSLPLGIGALVGGAAGQYAADYAGLVPILELISVSLASALGTLVALGLSRDARRVAVNLIDVGRGRYHVGVPAQDAERGVGLAERGPVTGG